MATVIAQDFTQIVERYGEKKAVTRQLHDRSVKANGLHPPDPYLISRRVEAMLLRDCFAYPDVASWPHSIATTHKLSSEPVK